MMILSRLIKFVLFSSLQALSDAAFTPCPILGPNYPIPPSSSLSNSTIIQQGLSDLTALLDQTIFPNNSTHGPTSPNTTSFSIALFHSASGNGASSPFFYEYHHTASSWVNQQIDADSIYRIGTLSQIFTVWAFLIETGEKYWNEPATRFIPELAQIAKSFTAKSDMVECVDWTDVTLGDLAGHMAGIGRECENPQTSAANFN
jgi:hypothetical protein